MSIELHLREPGLWAEHRTARRGGPALFLDRDGAVIEEVHYLRRVEDVRLTPGAAVTIRRMNERGVPVVMVTNQAGIARGLLDWPIFAAVQAQMHRLLALEDACIDAVYACALHGEGIAPFDVADHPWRKPNPGMLLSAAQDLAIVLDRSWVVGDRARDLEAGRDAGLAGGVLVATGYGADEAERDAAAALDRPHFSVRYAANLGALDIDFC